MNKCRKFLIILIVLIFYRTEVINSQVYPNQTLTRFAQIRKLYPKISTNDEARYWRMAGSDNLKDHPCKRECDANQLMTCYYYMVVHYDETMGPECQHYLDIKNRYKIGNREYINPYNLAEQNVNFEDCKYADGNKSEIMVVNGQLPGLSIEICVGDTIVADIINSLHETTTVHWHGIHQLNTPHMDGVPHVTQYPIEPGQAFRYRFEVDHAGTHWWHSHTNLQRAFGLAGALVVRQTRKENVHVELYDFDYTEHILIIQDWMSGFDEMIPKSILINGLGRNTNINDSKPILYSKFTVAHGGRYRFRVVSNAVTTCPISLSIDQHDLLLISSDGNDIEPIVVQKITFHGGERFDFILNANRAVNNYWIRVKGHVNCEIYKLHQEAILHYMGADLLDMPKGDPPTYSYGPPNAAEFNGVDVSISTNRTRFGFNDAKAVLFNTEDPQKPDHTLYTSMNIVTINGVMERFQMDDITFSMPKVSMLQTRNLGVGNFFCNRTQQIELGFDCLKRHCKCTNVLQVPAFKHIEMVIAGKDDSAHPIHLHGYTFRVVGMGVLGEDKIDKIEEIDRETPLPRRLSKAPLKDTVQVPGFGYTIIRFYTNNPGYWMFHCHYLTHTERGMSAVLRVGEDAEMKMCPVSNCGLCNSVS